MLVQAQKAGLMKPKQRALNWKTDSNEAVILAF
jgi:hypothetical protein